MKLVKWTIFFSNFLAFLQCLNFIVCNNRVRESGNEEMLKDKWLKKWNRHLCFLGQFNDYDYTKWSQNHPKVAFEFSCYFTTLSDAKISHENKNAPWHGLRTSREEIVFTAQPKIHSHSQIFRYGQSIFIVCHIGRNFQIPLLGVRSRWIR